VEGPLNDPGAGEAFDRLVAVMARLRGEGGCPWDREQDHASLKKYAIEETYELLDAIDEGDDAKVVEELGDLLLQVVFHAQMARERAAFSVIEVIKGITAKLIERHPHVFGDVEVADSAEVLSNWEEIKRRGRGEKGGKKTHRFSGIPKNLPALLAAFRIVEKNRDAGATAEELEARIRSARPDAPDAFGNLLLDIARLAAVKGIDPEEALRRANLRWIGELIEAES
jgi:MazG family protein